MAFKPNTTAGLALNEIGQRVHEPKKNRERRKRGPLNAKGNELHPKPLRNTNKTDGSADQQHPPVVAEPVPQRAQAPNVRR
jgi:hypothetical protein